MQIEIAMNALERSHRLLRSLYVDGGLPNLSTLEERIVIEAVSMSEEAIKVLKARVVQAQKAETSND